MFLHILKLPGLEYGGCHILICDPFIGEDGRSQPVTEIHVFQPVIILLCDPVVAGPQFLRLSIGQALQEPKDLFCLLHKDRQALWRQVIRIHIHFLCR